MGKEGNLIDVMIEFGWKRPAIAVAASLASSFLTWHLIDPSHARGAWSAVAFAVVFAAAMLLLRPRRDQG